MIDLAALTDADLDRMTDHAYREAARCYAEARRSGGDPSDIADPVARMLWDAAASADDFHSTLRAEVTRRRLVATMAGAAR